jgi:hypothetical protein
MKINANFWRARLGEFVQTRSINLDSAEPFGKEMMLRMCSRSKLPMDLSKEEMRKMTFHMLLPLVMAGKVDPVSFIIIIIVVLQ